MKEWKIKLTAKDEASAVGYLKMLLDNFEIASTHDLPLYGMRAENGDESLDVQMTKRGDDIKPGM